MRLRPFISLATAVALAVGGVAVAPAASALGAPIIWYQAVAVPAPTSPCPTSTATEARAGWTEWTNSWAEWPNAGKGGNVCTRSITWAHAADAASGLPSAGCIQSSSIEMLDFRGGWSLGPAEPAYPAFIGPPCGATPLGAVGFSVVYAPAGLTQATALCSLAFPGTAPAPDVYENPNSYGVWACVAQG